MLPPEEAESRLLASIAKASDIALLTREGISPESFSLYGSVYSYYVNFIREYGSIPSVEDIESQFNDSGITLGVSGELLFYAREVKSQSLAREAYSAITNRVGINAVRLMENPQEAVRNLTEDLRRLQPSIGQQAAYLDRDALQRLEWLQDKSIKAEQGQVVGIPTGLYCFDVRQQGWAPGEAAMVMAPKGTGKSWLLMYFGVVGYHAGYKVLFFSPEMSWQECALRFDVLYAYQKGTALSHEALTTGKAVQEVYEEWLKELTMRERFIVIDSPGPQGFTTNAIVGLIDEYRPDLVLVDGLHLLTGEVNQAQWDRIKNAADSLKGLAQHLNCTIIWSSQVDREAMRNPTEPAATGASAAYGKAAVEAANRLITLANHESNPKQRTFKVPNNRSGREYHNRQYLDFDVDIGCIKQVNAFVEGEEEAF